MEIILNKISLTGCKWSSLNAQGSETPVSHSFLENSILPFPAPAASSPPLSAVIRVPVRIESQLDRDVSRLTVLGRNGQVKHAMISPKLSLRFIMGGWVKRRIFFKRRSVYQAANGPA